MIALIDYGIGNLKAFVNLYQRLHIPVEVATTEEQILAADKLILPGVGHFDHAMKSFNDSVMRDSVLSQVKEKDVPLIGICVGMQMLANTSEEGNEPGLGLIPGKVRNLRSMLQDSRLPLPHMGWNDVIPLPNEPLFSDFCEVDNRFYFLHSFYFEPSEERYSIAKSNYGFDFTCAVKKNNVYGVQFHPEKSHHFGERLLKNFSEL